MGKNFKNINEELERIKTLIYETDSLILNEETIINEQTTPAAAATPAVSEPQQGGKFKTARSSFKLAKVSDVNTVLRGGAGKFDTYKVKGTGVISLFDKDGKMTPEGIELMKKSGLKLPAGQIVMRIGKVDDPNTDKVFFQVIPSKEISVVTQSGDIKNINPKELEQLPTVQDLKPTTPTPSAEVKPADKTQTAATKTFVEDGSIFGKKIEDLEKEYNLKIKDVTPEFKKMGWTASAYYKKNEETKTVYGTNADGVIKSMFKRMKSGGVSESFNMDLVFVNPLLFESVISEQETKTEGGEADYYVKIDSTGKETKMSDKFTQVVDGTYKGTPGEKKSSGKSDSAKKSDDGKPSASDDWSYYPCVTQNSAMKKEKANDGSTIYKDAVNIYYSNGRYAAPNGKTGDYHCEGKKIVAGTGGASSAAAATKYSIVTDADLMGETGLIRNLMKSGPVIASVAAMVTPIGIPLALLAAGGATAFNQVSRRSGVKGVVDALDFPVTADDLAYVLAAIKSLVNKFYNDEEVGAYVPATKRFLELYSEDEGGDSLVDDISSVGTRTLPTGSEKLKAIIIKTINTQANAAVPAELTSKGGVS